MTSLSKNSRNLPAAATGSRGIAIGCRVNTGRPGPTSDEARASAICPAAGVHSRYPSLYVLTCRFGPLMYCPSAFRMLPFRVQKLA
jgi:hypothetical protein